MRKLVLLQIWERQRADGQRAVLLLIRRHRRVIIISTLSPSGFIIHRSREGHLDFTQRPHAYIYIYIYIYIYHYVVPPARISLNLSRHFSISFIASGRSSGLHPVSSQSCCMYVRAGRPAFARPYVGVHRSTSLMSLLCPCFSSSVLPVWFMVLSSSLDELMVV